MKNLLTSLPLLALLVLFANKCKKDEESSNIFTFQGKSYAITEAHVTKIILTNSETNAELDIYQFEFLHTEGADTATLSLAVVDQNTNVLDGDYAGRSISSSDSRGLFPFLFFAASGIALPDQSAYLTGPGGVVSINKKEANFTINISNIPAGTYDEDWNFAEKGKIKGYYKGQIMMDVIDLREEGSFNPSRLHLYMKPSERNLP